MMCSLGVYFKPTAFVLSLFFLQLTGNQSQWWSYSVCNLHPSRHIHNGASSIAVYTCKSSAVFLHVHWYWCNCSNNQWAHFLSGCLSQENHCVVYGYTDLPSGISDSVMCVQSRLGAVSVVLNWRITQMVTAPGDKMIKLMVSDCLFVQSAFACSMAQSCQCSAWHHGEE